MNTEAKTITVSGLDVQVVRKPIKNLHLGVYPPSGRVRVAAPLSVSDNAVRLAVVGKLGWIKRQRARFEDQPRQSKREMVSGESHYFLGRRYRLRVKEGDGLPSISLKSRSFIDMQVRHGTSSERRAFLLSEWYRNQLRDHAGPLVEKWERLIGVRFTAWGIKRMKTKWGSCTIESRRIWLNLELVKKPIQCLEYLIVHELMHLLERHHNDRFTTLMDRHLPHWRQARKELNAAPLAHESWGY